MPAHCDLDIRIAPLGITRDHEGFRWFTGGCSGEAHGCILPHSRERIKNMSHATAAARRAEMARLRMLICALPKGHPDRDAFRGRFYALGYGAVMRPLLPAPLMRQEPRA